MTLSMAAAAALPGARVLAQPAAADAIAPQDEIRQLRSALFDAYKPSRERDEAAKRLLQREAYDVLLEGLRSGKGDVQVPVARALAEQENPPPVFLNELMTRCLQQQVTADLAEAASQAVANYRDNPAARARLRDFILSDNIPEGVRLPAVKALGTLNDKESARFLVETVLQGNDTRITQRLSDAAADALADMTGQTFFGRDVGQWTAWWQEQRDRSPEQFLADRRAERERRFGQSNASLRGLASSVDRLMFEMHRQAKTDADRETFVLRLLNDPDPAIRSIGGRLVVQERAEGLTVRPAVVARLRELIGDSSPEVRQRVAQAIRSINPEGAARPLLAQLRQERVPAVKADLMAALGPTKDVGAVPDLVRLLDDPSFQVSEAAARALADLGPEIAKSPQTTREVSNALARTIERTARRPGSSRLRENAVAAMVPLKDPILVPALFSLLTDQAGNTTAVRRSAIRALGAMYTTPLRNEIAQRIADEALNDKYQPGVRLEAAATLGLVGGVAQANALYARMEPTLETDAAVRDEAWKSLISLMVEFAPNDLQQWADVRFNKDPEKQVSIYRIRREKLIQAGGPGEELANVQERLGTLYFGLNQPAEAIAPLQAALDYWDKQPGAKVPGIQLSLIKAHLRARHYKEAVQFAQARIKQAQDPNNPTAANPNKEDMARAVLGEVTQLERNKQFAEALELLNEARDVDFGSFFRQEMDMRAQEIRSKIPALEKWFPRWWSEVVT